MVKVRLNELVEQAARNVTDGNGRFNKKDHVDAIKQLLATVELSPVTMEELRYRQAAKLAEGFVRTRQPRSRLIRRSSMPTLYSDGSLLVLNHGDRVWMQDATFTDLDEWGRLSGERVASLQNRQEERAEYVRTRKAVWTGRSDIQHLGELERHFFNYSADASEDIDGDVDDEEL